MNKINKIHIFKITAVALLISIAIALLCSIFAAGVKLFSTLAFNLFPYNLLFLPLVGFIIVYFKNLKIDCVANSMLKVFRATKQNEILSIVIIPFQIIMTWLSHFVGASVGKEGVALQLGAIVSNNISNKFGFDTKDFTSAGKAAGFSVLFGTPLAGVFFAYEMNKKQIKDYSFWYLAILMSFFSSFLANKLGVVHFKNRLDLHITLNWIIIIKLILISFIFILVGNLFVLLLKEQKKLYNNIFKNEYIKIIVLSSIFAFVMFYLNGRYMSLGTNLIKDSFNSPNLILYKDFLWKLILTTYIISIGFQGGELTPLFSIGATLGVALGELFNLPIALVAALGYSFVFASATNAYITSIFICFEVFGSQILPFAFLLFGISYLFKNKNSIYPLYFQNPIINKVEYKIH